nr:MAG: major capsid protein [Microviridae sp.]
MIMASYLDKTQVNTAITENTKLDLGHPHITTADFMQNNVAYIHEMVPGEKIDVSMESFARLNPLPVPTFGRASMRNRAYFVPFRTIFRGWNDFITDAPHIWSDSKMNSALLTSVPTVTNAVLASMFLQAYAQDIDSVTDGDLMYDANVMNPLTDAYDIYDGQRYLCFTQEGRQCLKVIESLGYKINWDTSDTKSFSALPLLALGKLACDWYYPQPYTGNSEYNAVLRLCNADTAVLSLTYTDVYAILKLAAYVQYDSDYFVSAFDLPNQPVADAHSDFKLVNLDSVTNVINGGSLSAVDSNDSYNSVTNNSGSLSWGNMPIAGANAPFIFTGVKRSGVNDSTNTGVISEYLLHALHAMTDYMKRHQLAGSRAFDRYLARFGKALPAEKLNRSNYLGAAMQDIQIGDIMSTADTSGAQLGSYAGKGMTYGNGHFEFSTDEFGYFIILSSIVPATGYFQGIDRQVMRTTKLSFWTPEYDSLGNQPITADELYISQNTAFANIGTFNTALHDKVFGFTPRYADYKVAHDSLTGNFRINSLNGTNGLNAGLGFNAADSWHLMRTFDDVDFGLNGTMDPDSVVHSVNFMKSKDWSQYKRIFYADSSVNPQELPDNFTVIHNFEIAAYAPMKALYDTYEFEDKGKKVTLDVNGVKMN